MSGGGKTRTTTEVSGIMRKVRSVDTGPELIFRRALWSKGFRYRTSPAHLPGKPDVVNASRRVAVFLDGDYWHGYQWRRRNLASLEDQFIATPSKDYWLRKIRANLERDAKATNDLISGGWKVLRFWESDLKRDLDRCVRMTLEMAEQNLDTSPFSLLAGKTVLEFFAGIGLMRMGLERHGWSVSFANDIDPAKYEMYQGHFQDNPSHFILGDVHSICSDLIPSASLATASFPCNDLSLAGSRNGLAGAHSSAFWGFISALRGMGARKPPVVLIENVTGFLTSDNGNDFTMALHALNDLGYVVDPFILDAARFVPQSRQRLFVVGQLKDRYSLETAVMDHGRFYESDVRPAALADFIFRHPEINWYIRDLPKQPARSVSLQDILEDLSDEAREWWSPERATYLLNQMSPRHRETAERMIHGDKWSYGTIFRRVRNGRSMAELRTDGVAGCLRTPRGGSGRQILFRAGKGAYRARLLTGRECARLMGADDFTLTGQPNQVLFGFGDAVCVSVIEWIARYYLNPLVQELLHGRPLRLSTAGVYRGCS